MTRPDRPPTSRRFRTLALPLLLAVTALTPVLAGRWTQREALRDAIALAIRYLAPCGLEGDTKRDEGNRRAAAAVEMEARRIVDELVRAGMNPKEVQERAARYVDRLSAVIPVPEPELAADTKAAKGVELGTTGSAGSKLRDPATAPAASPERGVAAGWPETSRAETGVPPTRSGRRLSIVAVSGESWETLRRRRTERQRALWARWLPEYNQAAGRLGAVRRRLERELRQATFRETKDLCMELARVAESLDARLVRDAPDLAIARHLEGALTRYSRAGQACRAGRAAGGFFQMTEADRIWALADRRVRGLVTASQGGAPGRPGLPRSLEARARP